ncbi:Aspartyl protease [Handroanthus impetiginosus]|uniref:Aspartyl protease n=1 Tax=Handroanthus impetiginosus TaxID=429701 RepID=A0A2G9H4L4_9LAMI|nr:Aspartyl protease [Handroanthus impetiginosus]
MASTLHCSFFPFVKFLFCSSLLSILVSICFIEKSNALEGGKANSQLPHLHTLQISSLLPASVCSHSTGSSKTQSTLKVFHRHGPCSKHTRQNPTTKPLLADLLSYDQSRAKSIQARLNFNSNTDNIKTTTLNKNKFIDRKANLPVQPGISLGSGNYLVTIGLGTPTKTLSLIFDTGSDLTWTQCEPCARSCYTQKDPIFNPASSSSYSNISCSSSQCSQLTSATGNDPACSSTTCVYGIQYGDQSFSKGFFSKDKLTISPTDVFPGFLFGCGQDNQGLFGRTSGLLGLGRDPLSVVSQTAAKYGRYFSYCLPSTSSSTGHLTFGKSSAGNAKFTPFASSQGASFYFIEITSIYIGGRQLSISETIFKNSGTIIDSGTVITRLPPTAYSTMSAAFKQLMKKYPSAPAYSILDTCFDFSGYTSVSIPTVTFEFGGGVKVDLHPNGILVAIGKTQACLAFAGNGDDTDVGIFGNTQQKTLEVVYDVAGGKLGFGAGGCK